MKAKLSRVIAASILAIGLWAMSAVALGPQNPTGTTITQNDDSQGNNNNQGENFGPNDLSGAVFGGLVGLWLIVQLRRRKAFRS